MRRAGLPPVGAAGATVGVAIGDHVGGLVNFMSQPEQPGRWMGFTRLRGMGEPGLSAVDRSGRGLSAEGLKRGDQYVLRPRSRVVLGLALSVCGALLCAVELVRAREGRRFFEASEGIGAKVAGAMMRRGVIARAMPQGDILGFAPPLCLTEAEADTIVGVTAEALAEVCGG